MTVWSAVGLKARNQIADILPLSTRARSDHYSLNYNANSASKAKSNLCQIAFNYNYNSDPSSKAENNLKREKIRQINSTNIIISNSESTKFTNISRSNPCGLKHALTKLYRLRLLLKAYSFYYALTKVTRFAIVNSTRSLLFEYAQS